MTPNGDIWIWAETTTEGGLSETALELLARARPLADKRGSRVKALVISDSVDDAQVAILAAGGADKIVVFESPELRYFAVAPYAACLETVVRDDTPEIFLAAATYAGRTLAPYVAARVRAGLTADCVELDIDSETGELLQTRPAIGGNIMATIKTPTARPQMATIRPNSTPIPMPDKSRKAHISRRQLPSPLPSPEGRRVSFVPSESCSLKNADKVVVIGRGIGKPANIEPFAEFAESIGAALGATREVVDRGWLPYSHQIGLSGKTITPKLYVGFGVSGAIQHLAGMRSAETIVAINTDPAAPIFQVADFGIVGDAMAFLPALKKPLDTKEAAR